jgi:raffinose/stachyose/melibiose transport system substrate-binding protein
MKVVKIVLPLLMVLSIMLSACAPAAAPTASSPANSQPTAAQPAAAQPTAAQPASSAAGQKVELTFWSMWNEPEPQAQALQTVIKAFEAANPNITINVVWNGRENQTKLRTALSSGTKVDFMDQDGDQVAGGMMSEGLGYPLDEFLTQNALDENAQIQNVFVPGVVDMFKAADGHHYLWPYILNVMVFWYSQDAFAKANVQPPTTWQEFLDVNSKLKGAGFIPLAQESDVTDFLFWWTNYLVERQKGPGFLLKAVEDKTGESWKDPVFLKTAQMLKQLWDSGYIPQETKGYTFPAGEQTLATGDAAMELCGSWLPAELSKTTGPDFKWGAYKFQAIDGGVGSADDLQEWPITFMILKDAPHPKEAFEFLKFVMTKESQTTIATQGIVGITRQGVDWPVALKDAQNYAAKAKTVIIHSDATDVYHPEFYKNVLGQNNTDMFLGKISPEQFVQKMADDSKAYWQTHTK